MPCKEHQDFANMNIFHPWKFKFWLEASIEFLSEMVSVSIKSPGLLFIQNWGSNSHNSIWVGLGCAVLGDCWQDWGSIPCHIPISSCPSTVAPFRVLRVPWIAHQHLTVQHLPPGGHGALQRALHVCTWPGSGSQEGSCWKDPMSEW